MIIPIEAYDFKNHKQLFTATVDFGPDLIHMVDVSDPEGKYDQLSVFYFLENRAEILCPKKYEDDEGALRKLDLLYNRHLFGRMREAYILIAMMDNFSISSDSIKIYPLKDEIVCFYPWAKKYSTIYVWRKRENDHK